MTFITTRGVLDKLVNVDFDCIRQSRSADALVRTVDTHCALAVWGLAFQQFRSTDIMATMACFQAQGKKLEDW